MVEPTTRGDLKSPLRWTVKSVNKRAEQLGNMGHEVCPKTVYNWVRSMDYSLQSNCEPQEDCDHPDRDKPFKHFAETVKPFQQLFCHITQTGEADQSVGQLW
uniref:ISAzo13-like element transposase-related protein n=1 Tax=Lyngbya confervoides TaxID=207921 RepID=UPI0035C90DD0